MLSRVFMRKNTGKKICRLLCAVFVFCILSAISVTAETYIRDLKGPEKTMAEDIMKQVVSGKRKHYVFTTGLTVAQMIRVNNAIDNTYYAGYNSLILNGKRSRRTGVVTYDVEIDGSRDFYRVNRLLEKYAKQIGKKYVNSKMSSKAKAKALVKGVAKKLSYKPGRDQDNTLKYLRRKKGDCSVYALLYFAACRECGLDCQFVHVDTDYGPHVCNRVKAGRKWFYTDVSWYDCGKRGYMLSRSLWSSHRSPYCEANEAYSTLTYLLDS